jgi:thiamine biosynthesis lipoprotein
VSALVTLAACGSGQQPKVAPEARIEHFGGPTMGSSYEVKYVAGVPVAEVRAAVEAELVAFDATFSTWGRESELVRVNAHASTAPFAVSERFAAVLQLALAVAAATDGAFDPTVKPLGDLYRAAKRDPEHRLDPQALAAAKARVDFRRVQLRGRELVKQRGDEQLDLDGLVAGAACDAIAVRLHALGVRAFYLQVTGEVLCRGEKAPGEPWRIGVVDPRADGSGGDVPIRTLPLRDAALCTSGDYRNAFVADGRAVHHVFDPRSGDSASTGVVSASVLAPSAALADALGTALMVLGEQAAQRAWPALERLGATGALLLLPDDAGGLRAVELQWPRSQ